MGLLEDINNDLKIAMKAKDRNKLDALRAIKSALLVARTEKGAAHEITPGDEIKIVQRLVKQRKESADIYITQNRNDLADKELLEVDVISEYLPKQMTDEELTSEVQNIIQESGASSMKDMGKVMGIATKKLAGKAEGKKIAGTVKTLLNG